jgi:predicted ATPase
MKIKSFQVKNYKSWNDSGDIKLKNGLNVIVGQNNAGKTALLEAMSLTIGSRPHNTIESKPHRDSYVVSDTKISVTFEYDENELFIAALSITNDFFVPISNQLTPGVAIEEIAHRLKKSQTIKANFTDSNLRSSRFEDHWYNSSTRFIRAKRDAVTRSLITLDGTMHNENHIGDNVLNSVLVEQTRKRIYFSRAERYNISQSNIRTSNYLLDEKATNLGSVLHSLHSSNPARFAKIVKLLNKIFNRIQLVTVPVVNETMQVVIWTIDPKSERDDLAIPLSECGTGVGQVLAMLYIIVSSDYPQCILIDEPQSFLHPGAIRALMEIFRINSQHQYIITTHSPSILSDSLSQVIHVVHDGIQSKAKTIDGLKANESRLILEDLGFKLADVFGADKILWVEGTTEEECFKLILRKKDIGMISGIEILGVRNTGDLEGKQAKTVYDIYSKLSSGIGIIPPAVGFLFDRELRSEKEIDDLKRTSDNKMHFLPRRMFENYLLNTVAIASVVNRIEGFANRDIAVEEIERWIRDKGSDKTFIADKNSVPFDSNWIGKVNGSKILSELFNSLSETRVSYSKVKFGFYLTEKILEIDPTSFDELYDLISEACNN